MAGAVAGKEIFDGRTFGEIDGFFGVADNFFQTAEEEDLDANCGGGGWHRRIVTLRKSCGQ